MLACVSRSQAIDVPFTGPTWPGWPGMTKAPAPGANGGEIYAHPDQNMGDAWSTYSQAYGVSFQVWGVYYKATDEMRPVAVRLYRTMYGYPVQNGSVSMNLVQTHIWSGGNLVRLANPRNAFSTSTPVQTVGGVDTEVFMDVAGGIVSLATNANAAYRTGRFRMEIVPNSIPGASAFMCYFDVKTWDNSAFTPSVPGAGGGGGGSGVGAGDPTVEGQNGFWQALFVPSSEKLEDLADAAGQFREWGPFGVATALGAEMQGITSSVEEGECPYCFELTNSEFTGPVIVNLTPMEPFLRVTRMVILAVLVWGMSMSMLRWLSKSGTVQSG